LKFGQRKFLTTCDVVNPVILRPKAEESLANVSLFVILRPKAEESLANARNEEKVSGTSPEILRRFTPQDDSLAVNLRSRFEILFLRFEIVMRPFDFAQDNNPSSLTLLRMSRLGLFLLTNHCNYDTILIVF